MNDSLDLSMMENDFTNLTLDEAKYNDASIIHSDTLLDLTSTGIITSGNEQSEFSQDNGNDAVDSRCILDKPIVETNLDNMICNDSDHGDAQKNADTLHVMSECNHAVSSKGDVSNVQSDLMEFNESEVEIPTSATEQKHEQNAIDDVTPLLKTKPDNISNYQDADKSEKETVIQTDSYADLKKDEDTIDSSLTPTSTLNTHLEIEQSMYCSDGDSVEVVNLSIVNKSGERNMTDADFNNVTDVLPDQEDAINYQNAQENVDEDMEEFQEEDLGDNPDFFDFDICQRIFAGKTKYRFCVLHLKIVNNRVRIYATVLGAGNDSEDIKVNSLLSECMGADDKDEVIIEIDRRGISLVGHVVHVYRRFVNTSRHKIVCECGENNSSLVPIHNLSVEPINVGSCNSLPNHLTLYRIEREGRLVFDHYEPLVDNSDYLYEVSYLDPKSYHCGSKALITRQIPKDDVNESILKVAQNISCDFSDDVIDSVNSILQHYKECEIDAYDVSDLRNQETFTICTEHDSLLPSMTLSITPSVECCYDITVHIPDIVTFVDVDCEVDSEARDRGLSVFVPGRGILHMLPPQLVTNMWQFRPRIDALAWSVVVTVDKNWVCVSHDVKHSVICVNRNVLYHEVAGMVKNPTTILERHIQKLHEFAVKLRSHRLVRESASEDTEFLVNSETQIIIAELTVIMNTILTKTVLQHFPDITPLLYQPPPNVSDDWINKYVSNPVFPFVYQNLEENGSQPDSGVFNGTNSVVIYIDKVKELQKAMQLRVASDKQLEAMVAHTDNFPILQIATREKQAMVKPEMFVCSDENKKGHYTLNVEEYCTFTQPMHVYIDLVAQRLLNGVINNKGPPYDNYSIDDICNDFNKASTNAKNCLVNLYQQHLLEALTVKPLSLLMIIEEINDTEIKLRAARIAEDILSNKYICDLKFNTLAISEIPNISLARDQVTVAWQERIYDLLYDGEFRASMPEGQKRLFISRFAQRISKSTAVNIVNAVKTNGEIREYIQDMYDEVTMDMPDLLTDVTSEVPGNGGEPRLCDFSATYHVGDVIRVQVANDCTQNRDPALQLFKRPPTLDMSWRKPNVQTYCAQNRDCKSEPALQLLELTPTLDICIEHQRKQAAAFVPLPTLAVNFNSYPNIDVYKDTWKAIVKYEAAESAVRVKEGSILHNVNIQWEQNGDVITGSFYIDRMFYEEQGRSIPRNGYICARYKNIPMSNNTDWPKTVADLYGDQSTITWTCHCCDVKLMIKERENEKTHTSKFIHFCVHSSSISIPDVLLSTDGQKLQATLEWLPTPQPYVHMLNALNGMHEKGYVIAKDIALGEQPGIVEADQVALPDDINLPGLAMNDLQHEAIKNAFAKPFSLIHGPPGTGKTLTGALLAYHLLTQNKVAVSEDLRTVEKWQVLYCTPSNKAADVVIDNLRKIRTLIEPHTRLNVIRVYSPRIEQQDYPIPGRQKNVEKSSFDMDTKNRDVALHHLIRITGQQTHIDAITANDHFIKNNPDLIDEKYLKKYRENLMKASKALLATADIIVTTCTGAAAGRIANCLIRQVIIDEGGMSSEPEALIPIVNHTPKQVVIIGDHKQLETIVLTDVAKQLGMKRSIFERYAHQAIMLITQYRMHEMIAKFPSDQFYDGKLVCGKPEQKEPSHLRFWPGGAGYPLAFCHLIGVESSQVIATKDGSEQSKKNIIEAEGAVRVAELMIQHGIKPPQIAILTQYRAQQALIKELLTSELDKQDGVTVSTVIASQGNEWDYVIFSMVRSTSQFEGASRSGGWLKQHLGFIMDEHQMNVSLTRARQGLILIGNARLLQHHEMWGRLIQFYQEHHAFLDYSEFIRKLENTVNDA